MDDHNQHAAFMLLPDTKPNRDQSECGSCIWYRYNFISIWKECDIRSIGSLYATHRLLRATSHRSQEPWPCNGEDPWLSSRGRTMCVGKAIIWSHGPSSIVWSENGPCCGTIAYFVGEKEGRIWFNIICLKLYQFKRIMWWCLSVLKSILEYVLEYALESNVEFVLLEKILKKSWSPRSFVRPTSWRWAWRKF